MNGENYTNGISHDRTAVDKRGREGERERER
jgi:hypothetical protein